MGRSGTVEGIYCKLAAVALFAVIDTLIKWQGSHYPTMQLMVFRSAVSFIPVLAIIWWAGGWHSIRTYQPGLQLLRVAFGLGSTITFFWTLPRLPLVEVYAISYAAPLLMTALSVPLLAEQVGWRRWSAIAVGFLGTLIVLDPWGGSYGVASIIVAFATFFYSMSSVLVRRLSRTDSDAATMFYLTAAATLLSGAFCLLDPAENWRPVHGADLLVLCSLGLIGGVAQIFITRSLRLAPPAVLAPFEYASILFAFTLGYAFFSETLTSSLLLGLPLIIGSGLYILHRERSRSRA